MSLIEKSRTVYCHCEFICGGGVNRIRTPSESRVSGMGGVGNKIIEIKTGWFFARIPANQIHVCCGSQ